MAGKEIAAGVFLIDTFAAGVPGLVASYLIKGEKSALIDVGHASSADTVLSQLHALDAWQVDYLIPTHVHLDHAGAVGRLASAMPRAQVLVNEHGAKHLIDPARLIEWQERLFGTESLRVLGRPLPVPKERVKALGDRYELNLGAGKELTLLWTPGHAPHHMCVFLEDQRFLFTGDAVGVHYSDFDAPIPVTPPPSFDEELYTKTVGLIMAMSPASLLLPHFGPILGNTREFLQANLETIRRWGARVHESVAAGEPLSRVYEFFLSDAADKAGKPAHEVPEHIKRSIRLSAAGYYSYAQRARAAK